ncbi:unnamed protein product [Bathycoccus prasinos]
MVTYWKPTKMPNAWKDIIEEECKYIARGLSERRVCGALEDKGFHNIEWATEYSFEADENGKKCPCCGNVHDNNCWKVSQAEDTGSIFVKSFSDRCNSTLLIRGTKRSTSTFAFVLDNEPCTILSDTLGRNSRCTHKINRHAEPSRFLRNFARVEFGDVLSVPLYGYGRKRSAL